MRVVAVFDEPVSCYKCPMIKETETVAKCGYIAKKIETMSTALKPRWCPLTKITNTKDMIYLNNLIKGDTDEKS